MVGRAMKNRASIALVAAALVAALAALFASTCGDPTPPDTQPWHPSGGPPQVAAPVAEDAGAGAAPTEGATQPAVPLQETPVPQEVLVARERAAALFEQDSIGAALAELEPLLLRTPVDPSDEVRVAICVRELGDDPERVQKLLASALGKNEADAAAHYVLGRQLFELGEPEAALVHFERASALAPDDYPTTLALAAALFEVGDVTGDPELLDRSEQLLAALFERGVEFGGSWYLTVAYRYGRLLIDRERSDEGRAVLARWNELKQREVPEPTSRDLLRGSLGRVAAPAPSARAAAPARGEVAYDAVAAFDGLPTPGHALALSRRENWHSVYGGDVEGGLPRPGGAPELSVLGPSEWYWASANGLWLLDASGAKSRVLEGDFTRCVPIELGEEREERLEVRGEIDGKPYLVRSAASDLELVVARGADVVLYTTGADGAWASTPEEVHTFDGAVRALATGDVDHDGDLDVVAIGAFGAAVLRHDGAGAGGAFTAVPFDGARTDLEWLVLEDFDTDQDVDVLAGGPGGAHLFDNERGGAWRDVALRVPEALRRTNSAPLVFDVDGDALPDLVGRTAWFKSAFGEVFAAREGTANTNAIVADVGASGVPDLVEPADEGLFAARVGGGERVRLVEGRVAGVHESDVDRDGLVEFVVWNGGDVRVFERRASDPSRSLSLALEGVKDNARGVGAIVELRAGDLYRRVYWRGEPLAIGLGAHTLADVVRVTWPNGVVQSHVDVPTGRAFVIEQAEGLVGSCPFLYTWNGETFEFISDVIGITPLGLPIAPGVFVPPDHDEYVLVRGEQLVPKDGELVIQLTEELREVTYFDAVHLEAVDHPIGSEVFPNERFTFPPFPEAKVHTVTRSHAALRASGSDGRDWTAELAAVDMAVAIPFTAFRGQFPGLATPHWLELAFDPSETATMADPRLVMTGWLYWTDASVNMASARHPAYEFVPPIIEVPDGAGGWRAIGPPVGFPAGKTKTMVIDLAGHLDPADPRVRVSSTLRLYWDEIRLAVCDGAAPIARHVVSPKSARLWERGFSEPVLLAGDARLEWFEWDRLASAPRWNQHPGDYTRLGDVKEMLLAVDDRFVVMGAGDALTVAFDASLLPPLAPGMRRDWLVFLDGWAKDRDPNTNAALFVEPHPFHAMTTFPPQPGEAPMDPERTARDAKEWHTRPARRLITPLVPHRP
jgi:tetratricopeptide (TPR) repeat protein